MSLIMLLSTNTSHRTGEITKTQRQLATLFELAQLATLLIYMYRMSQVMFSTSGAT